MVYLCVVLALLCLCGFTLWLVTRRDLILEKNKKVSILRELVRIALHAKKKTARGANEPF